VIWGLVRCRSRGGKSLARSGPDRAGSTTAKWLDVLKTAGRLDGDLQQPPLPQQALKAKMVGIENAFTAAAGIRMAFDHIPWQERAGLAAL